MKSNKYMDRALKSPDGRYARVLTKLGYVATTAKKPRVKAQKPPAADLLDEVQGDVTVNTLGDTDAELAAFRAEYENKTGRRPSSEWDASEVRSKIDRYERRDMRAVE